MIEPTGNDLVVIADNPAEMVEAQQATISVIGSKLDVANQDLADATTTLDTLVASGMATGAAERMVKRAQGRVLFLDKAKQALEAGYVIVPEMPCDVIAIRVKRKPRAQHYTNKYVTPSLNSEDAPGLPAGEGDYVDPLPESEIRHFENKKTDGSLETVFHRKTTGSWDSEIALPAEFLRPTVVQRTGKMMARRLFDEVAVIGASSRFTGLRARKADPMVIGSVIDPVNKRKLWFLVAWFVDTGTI